MVVGLALPEESGWHHRARSSPTPNVIVMSLTQSPERTGWWEKLLRRSAYGIAALPLSVVFFTVTVTGLSLGFGLLITVAGVFVLAAMAYIVRGGAHLERYLMRHLLGWRAPEPIYQVAPKDSSLMRRTLTPLRDPQSWLDAAWGLISLATGILAFVVTVAWWGATLGGLTYWFWEMFLPEDGSDETLAHLIGLGSGRTADVLLTTGLGVVAAITLPLVVQLVTMLHGGLAHALLCSRAELQGDVRRASESRDAARRAEAEGLRRLERDIHDGPQQRLVRLTMDLGLAARQLDKDPSRARELIEAAQLQARETVDELRSLSRGIAPPVLVDRGLHEALREANLRSPIPVTLKYDVPGQLPADAETTAYFVVAEALTNAAKHSGADAVQVDLARYGDRLQVRVADNGRGGAALGKGHGLTGLADRVRAADGTLQVSSPAGGPTIVEAVFTCGS